MKKENTTYPKEEKNIYKKQKTYDSETGHDTKIGRSNSVQKRSGYIDQNRTKNVKFKINVEQFERIEKISKSNKSSNIK